MYVSGVTCNTTRETCCSYNTKYGMIPHVTPQNEKNWHSTNNCDDIMGGRTLSNCPYTCGNNYC